MNRFLSKITRKNKAFFLAYDQGLEHGPTDFDEYNVDPHFIFQLAVKGKFTAVITQKGIAENYYKHYKYHIPLVIKLNGKTNLTDGDPFSPLLCSVERAKEIGASAVGYTVYLGSHYESEMLATFSTVIEQAHALDMAAIGWMYPRGGKVQDDTDPDIVAYAARVGLELGADMVKIKYPGSVKALRWVVECAGTTQVVVAGGKKLAEHEVGTEIKNFMDAGVSGVAIGRNIWQQQNPLAVAAAIRPIVFNE